MLSGWSPCNHDRGMRRESWMAREGLERRRPPGEAWQSLFRTRYIHTQQPFRTTWSAALVWARQPRQQLRKRPTVEDRSRTALKSNRYPQSLNALRVGVKYNLNALRLLVPLAKFRALDTRLYRCLGEGGNSTFMGVKENCENFSNDARIHFFVFAHGSMLVFCANHSQPGSGASRHR
jgi:hypothetical protein